jgi:hypothetical protein
MAERHTVIPFDGEPDNHGQVFAPGCVQRTPHVPVTMGFDNSKIVGEATVNEDGTADVRFSPGIVPPASGVEVSVGYVVERYHMGEDGVRRVDALRPICLALPPPEGAR